ncbi:hypothetical protein HG530_009501 [Fusarium avenaceum]|nr:hypothetical protein HG530_009501 [Fusarium avenaceum]
MALHLPTMFLENTLITLVIRIMVRMSLRLDKSTPLASLVLGNKHDVVHVVETDWSEGGDASSHDDEGVFGTGCQQELADVEGWVGAGGVGFEFGAFDDGDGSGAV